MRRPLVVLVIVALTVPAVARAEDGERWDATTMALQVGGGLGGGVVGGGLGLLIGASIGAGTSKSWGAPLVGGALGGLFGGTAGVILGVQLVGDAKDGTGRWWGTTIGAVAGVATTLTITGQDGFRRAPKPLVIGAAVVLILAPPLVGYHLSADDRAPVMAVPLSWSF